MNAGHQVIEPPFSSLVKVGMFFSYIRKRSFLNIKEIRLIMLMDILRKL